MLLEDRYLRNIHGWDAVAEEVVDVCVSMPVHEPEMMTAELSITTDLKVVCVWVQTAI